MPIRNTFSLADTRDALLAMADPFRRADVHRVVRSLQPRVGELDRYLNFSDRGYTRTQFYRGPRFEILVLCWKDGQASPIHDHSQSICSMAVVHGVCRATNYRPRCTPHPDHGETAAIVPIEPAGTEASCPGQVVTVESADIHQIVNQQGSGRDLVTIHFYLPPIDTMRVFDESTGRCKTIRPETRQPKSPASGMMFAGRGTTRQA
jgi:cysteine dioxygenase